MYLQFVSIIFVVGVVNCVMILKGVVERWACTKAEGGGGGGGGGGGEG